jgi:hypothetical protein
MPQSAIGQFGLGTRSEVDETVSSPAVLVVNGSARRTHGGVIDDHALVSRGMTLTVAERAGAPIIGLRYGLPWYFDR